MRGSDRTARGGRVLYGTTSSRTHLFSNPGADMVSLRMRVVTGVLGALLVLAPTSLAQTGEDVLRFGHRDHGFSARTLGLAGATVGGIADWGATVGNPASLALARRAHVTGSLDLTTTASEARTGDPVTARATRFMPGHGAYVASLPTLRGAFVVGLGYHRLAGLDRRTFFEAAGGDGRWSQFFESGWLSELSAVGALEVAPRIYLGASFNVPIGQFAFTEFEGEGGDLLRSTYVESDLRGFNLRGGLVVVPADGFRLGLSFESPTWLYAEESFGDLRPGPERINYTMQLPWRVAAGAVYQFEGLLVSADLEFSDWAQARLRPSGRYADENHDIDRFYRETLGVRIGSEYDFGLGAVRAGYALSPDPLRDEIEADRTRHTFASGVSFYLPRGITLDLGVSYTEFRDQVFTHGQVVTETVGRLRALAGMQINL